MFHRSERLLLRPVFEEDWEAIYDGINDQTVVRMLANAPWPYGVDDARAFASRKREPGPSQVRFAITLPCVTGSKLIGVIGMGDRGNGVEIGYWVARAHWGNGYATEAGRAVIEIARMLGHRRLVAGHAIDNPASGRVLSKLGFRPTGEVSPEHFMGRGDEIPVVRYLNEIAEKESEPDPSMMPKAA